MRIALVFVGTSMGFVTYSPYTMDYCLQNDCECVTDGYAYSQELCYNENGTTYESGWFYCTAQSTSECLGYRVRTPFHSPPTMS